jgi:hypothetical protein
MVLGSETITPNQIIMKKSILFYFFIALILISCQDQLDEDIGSIETRSFIDQESTINEKTVFRVNDQSFSKTTGKDEAQLTKTELGSIRTNPYTVESMQQAHINLYGNLESNIVTTDLYVKFEPKTLDDIVLLEETEEFFYDYPLEYEVIKMGDYYQETIDEELPILYAIVDVNFEFPNVDYLIIAELFLDRSDPLLVAESYNITGNGDDIHRSIPKSDGIDPSEIDDDKVGSIPTEPIDCPEGFIPVLQIIDVGGGPVEYEWVCIEDNQTTSPDPNDCGCVISSNRRKPGGCVQVEDTELSPAFRGVRRVKVIAKDTWFTEDETLTNNKGCWRIDKEYKGRAWFWIRFTNDRIKIRGTAKNWKAIWQWVITIRDFVGMKNNVFNDITIKYEMYQETGSQAQRYWGAATVNNSMHEFHDYSNFDGINTPPEKLDVYVGRNNRYGYALMSAQNFFSQTTAVALAAATSFTGPFAPLIAALGGIGMQVYLPEVYIGINFRNSDDLKWLAYHEIAHSSHYTNVGDGYWGSLAAAEVFANGHGDQFSNNAGIISVCESWAEHIGLTYADRTYGTSNSLFSHSSFSERQEQVRNESLNHIPVGLYNDLTDNTPDSVESCDEDSFDCCCALINDQASGHSNSALFNLLDGATTTPQIFINRLNSTVSPQEQSRINNLFGGY